MTTEGGRGDHSTQISRRGSDVEQTEAEEAGDEVDEQEEVGETEEAAQDSRSVVQESEEGGAETEGNCEF